MDSAELVVVGSGPAGYTAAIYAGRAGLQPTVYEGSMSAGGALMETTEVENYPGFPDGVDGRELMAHMRKQAERFGAHLIPDDIMTMDLAAPDQLIVTDSSGSSTTARSIILAMGSAHRRLGVSGESEFSGHGVSWCATCDGYFYRDRDVVVVGGGDSAMEEALFLARFARSVTVVHRGASLSASAVMQDRAFAEPKINFEWNTRIISVHGQATVERLRLEDTHTQEQRTLATHGLFVAIGHDPRSSLVQTQVKTDQRGHVLTRPPGTSTSRAGVFACGDLVDNRYQQAITAAASGCQAAMDADNYLEGLGPRGTRLTTDNKLVSDPAESGGQDQSRSSTGTEATTPMISDNVRAEPASDSTFATILDNSTVPVLVDFWAPWCGPCALVHPVMDALAHEHEGALRVVKVNVDDCPLTADRFEVTSLPALKLFVDGHPVETLIGAKTKTTLLALLAPYLGQA